MPILKEEISLFPESLLDAGYQVQLATEGHCWWAVYTRSRREKELMRRLMPKQVGFYCPIVPRPYRSPNGRTRTSLLPVFPNYVFVCGTEEDRYAVVSTGCISKCLPVADADRLVDELRQFQHMIAAEVPLTPESTIQPGTPVRVKSGPMQGIEGVVFERRGERRLLVEVSFLQQGASVEIDDWLIERL